MRIHGLTALAGLALALASCTSAGTSPPAPTGTVSTTRNPATGKAAVPTPAHVIVVVMENRSYGQLAGDRATPYITSLARRGASFTNAHAVAHPSEPNYLALFSGSTQGVTSDSCPHAFPGVPNLASELSARHLTFAGYAESMPAPGYTGCSAGEYARKHNPWVDFPSVPTADSRTFAGFPGAHSTSGAYARLPTVSFVIPNLCDDMHDCSIGTGDAWLRARMDGYVRWARTHDSLFILTFDENDGANGNRIPLIIVGEHVRPGSYGEGVSHYTVLRTLEDAFGLPYAGHSVSVAPITNIWD